MELMGKKNRHNFKLVGTLGVLTFFCQTSLASLDLVLVDTQFCPSIIQKIKKPNLSILPPRYFSGRSKRKCDLKKLDHIRYHGQRVLELFLNQTQFKTPTTLHLWSPYHHDGKQSLKSWKTIIKELKKMGPDMVFGASTLPLKKPIQYSFSIEAPWFLPTGNKSGLIKDSSFLFPSHSKVRNIFPVGGLHWEKDEKGKLDDFHLDQTNLRPHMIKFYQSSGTSVHKLRGTSRAATLASAAFFRMCQLELAKQTWAKCLKNRTRNIKSSDGIEVSSLGLPTL